MATADVRGRLFVVFTDLDGCLLDLRTYKWGPAVPALQACKRRSIPVILTSSKTRAEIEYFQEELSISSAPFISENGGAVFFPEGTENLPEGVVPEKGLWVLPLGTGYPRLVRALKEIRTELDWDIKGFSDMDPADVAALTGLNRELSALAALREYDEPFLVVNRREESETHLIAAASRRGLRVTAGGRFYHLHGKNDKGSAVRILLSWYRGQFGRVVSAALGDSPNDLPMFEHVDHPVLIRSERDFPLSRGGIRNLEVTEAPGPEGWNSAVLEILDRWQEADHDSEPGTGG